MQANKRPLSYEGSLQLNCLQTVACSVNFKNGIAGAHVDGEPGVSPAPGASSGLQIHLHGGAANCSPRLSPANYSSHAQDTPMPF